MNSLCTPTERHYAARHDCCTAATDITLVSIVSSPEGVAEVEKHHPKVPIYTATLDRALNAKKYILPGLGDFGDRLYGT